MLSSEWFLKIIVNLKIFFCRCCYCWRYIAQSMTKFRHWWIAKMVTMEKPKSNLKTHLSFVHVRVRLRIWIAWYSQLVQLYSYMSWWMHCVRYTHRLFGIWSVKYSDSIARNFQLSDLTFSATLAIFFNCKFSDTILYDYFIKKKKTGTKTRTMRTTESN